MMKFQNQYEDYVNEKFNTETKPNSTNDGNIVITVDQK